jgi:hypothetical protein
MGRRMLYRNHRFIVGHGDWLEQFGEAELIGGWAEVALDDDFAALVECPGYQVFLTSYDPVQLFVQNRTAHSFEIHALPGLEGRRRVSSSRCGYRVEGRRADRPKGKGTP